MRLSLITLADSEYVLQLALHHTVCDGWSLGIVARQLEQAYRQAVDGLTVDLESTDVEYKTHAANEREWLESSDYVRSVEYWKDHLASGTPAVLPGDLSPDGQARYGGKHHMVWFNAGLSERIREHARELSVTVYQYLATIVHTLIARRSGEYDLTFGAAMLGRETPELENVVGFFVNTVAIRTGLQRDLTFAEAVAATRKSMTEAHEYQRVPFERVVEAVSPTRAAGKNPLFRIMVDFQGARRAAWHLPNIDVEGVDVETGTAQFDLKFMFIDDGSRISCGIEYNTDMYSGRYVSFLATEMTTLTRSCLDDDSVRLGDLVYVSDSERLELLAASQGPEVHPTLRTALARFDEHVSPELTAVRGGGTSLSYAGLDARANQLANHLQSRGLGTNDLVGIALPRSVDMVIALLAVWKCGAAYVPLDPSYPVQRLDTILREADPKLVLTWVSVAIDLDDSRLVYLDTGWDLIAEADTAAPSLSRTLDSVAYVIYTSGTTGVPKGVSVSHLALSNYLDWCAGFYVVHRGEYVPVHTSFSYDLTVTSLVYGLASGACLELVPEGPGVEELCNALSSFTETDTIALLKCTPAQLRLMANQHLEDDSFAPSIRTIVVGGEVLRPSSGITVWQSFDSQCRIVNEYGPSEATVGCVTYDVPQYGGGETDIVPVGRPIPNTFSVVLDEEGELCPWGVPGELWVGGRSLADGYRGHSDWTHDRFLHVKPLSQRGYRTGDLAMWGGDGQLLCIGRTDDQVKIRGYRVEPREIELVMQRHAGVKAAAVVPVGSGSELALIGYFVAEAAVDESSLRRHLTKALPSFMVPRHLVALTEMPLAASGKVDRAALPVPSADPSDGRALATPTTETEAMLLVIWAEILGRDDFSIDDDFFDLGGESLLATQVIARARRAVNFKVPLVTIFEAATVRDLAAAIRAMIDDAEGT